MSQPKRIIHKTTAVERRDYQNKVASENRNILKAQGKLIRTELASERARIDQACQLLKAEREAQGISLADMAQRTRGCEF